MNKPLAWRTDAAIKEVERIYAMRSERAYRDLTYTLIREHIDHRSLHALRRSDIAFAANGVKLQLLEPTAQGNSYIREYLLIRELSILCPIRALETWLSILPPKTKHVFPKFTTQKGKRIDSPASRAHLEQARRAFRQRIEDSHSH